MKKLHLTCSLDENAIEIIVDPFSEDKVIVIEDKVRYTLDSSSIPPLFATISVLMKTFDHLKKRKVKGFKGVDVPDAFPESI